MTKSLRLLAVMIGAFALTVFLSRHQTHDISIWIAVATMMTVIYIPFAVPAVGTFITIRPRKVFWAGVALVVAGLGGFFIFSFTSSFYGIPNRITGDDAVSIAIMYVVMIGISLTVLPRSIAAQKRLVVATSRLRETRAKQRSVSGIREGWDANVAMVQNIRSFVRIVGPWIVLLWAVPLVGLHLAAYLRGITPTIFALSTVKVDVQTALFGELFPTFGMASIAYPTVLVAWHRFILQGRVPRIMPLPDVAAMRYLFRLWMIAMLVGIIVGLTASNAPDLTHLLGMSDDMPVAIVILIVAACVLLYIGSQFTLVFPAVAVGNRNFLGAESAYVARRLGPSFPIGFVFSLVPYGLLAWASIETLQYADLSGPILSTSLGVYAFRLIPQVAVFLALASCATYLSRVYATRSKEYAEISETPRTI